MFREAKKLGDTLIVVLNNDNWVKDKKGYVFMPAKERKEVIESIKYVDKVALSSHIPGDADKTIARELRRIRPDIFANGGGAKHMPGNELDTCRELGIQLAYDVGGRKKVQSSSRLVQNSRH